MARQGAGLGLANSKAYVDMLGGKLWLESQKGDGATFYFTLPYNSEFRLKEDPNSSFQEDELENQIKPLTILIVEDDEMSRLLMSLMFEHTNYTIIQAKNGIEAVEMCQKNTDIDLVLMDLRMPKMDGYEATRQIRQFNKELIIIAQTAYALSGDKQKALEAGCNEHLSKPIIKKELFLIIKRYFGISR
jgi:CheY-like chemotaxis protein